MHVLLTYTYCGIILFAKCAMPRVRGYAYPEDNSALGVMILALIWGLFVILKLPVGPLNTVLGYLVLFLAIPVLLIRAALFMKYRFIQS